MNIALTNPADLNDLTVCTDIITYICNIDQSYALTSVSPEVEALLGYSVDDFLSNTNLWINNIHPADKEKVIIKRQSLSENTSIKQTYRFKHKNGNYYHILEQAYLKNSTADNANEIIGNWSNLNASTESDLTLEVATSQLDATLNAIVDGILVVDMHGNIVNYNDRFLEMWRIPEDIIRTHDEDQSIAYVLDQLIDPDAFLLRKNSVFELPEVDAFDILKFKDGRIFERYSKPQMIDKKVIGKVLCFRDITDREENKQKLLINKREAERANIAKSEFIANMSHELRTSLNAILGYSQMFKLDEALSDHYKDNAGRIYHAGKHLLNLINGILDLSRVESGHVDMTMESVSIAALLEDCQSTMLPLLANGDNCMAVSLSNCSNTAVYADYTRLKQVILNLLSNAVKYNSEHGWIKVSCDISDTNSVFIRITDDGAGISSSKQAELFQPFNRLGAESHGIEGTGLGLVISKQLIELMGGTLGVNSEPGHGSTFWVELDLYSTGDKVNTTSNIINIQSSMNSNKIIDKDNMHILIAEDSEFNQEVMQQQLLVLGYTADFAYNGVEALALLKNKTYDLLLTDINMPEMNGFELVNQIRIDEIRSGERLPIIAITADDINDEAARCLEAGMDAFVAKPIDLTILKNTLEQWLPETSCIK